MAGKTPLEQRNDAIRAAHAAGGEPDVLARGFGVSVSTIYRVVGWQIAAGQGRPSRLMVRQQRRRFLASLTGGLTADLEGARRASGMTTAAAWSYCCELGLETLAALLKRDLDHDTRAA